VALAQIAFSGGHDLKRASVWMVLLILMGWSVWRFSQPALAPQMHAALAVPDASKVSAMELTLASGVHVHLKEKDGTWLLAGLPDVRANSESVRKLLDDLASMRVIRVVTHTHTHDDALGMSKGVKLVLLNQTNTVLFTLTVGKQGSDLISTYVRPGQAPEVLAVDKSLVWQVKRPPNAWKAPALKSGDINKVSGKTGQGGKKVFSSDSS